MKSTINQTSAMTVDISRQFAALIESAPEAEVPITGPAPAKRDISPRTELPRRYRCDWERPELDLVWMDYFERLMKRVDGGGIIALIGPRGTGKTRLAAEAMRNHSPDSGTYTTAMGLLLRIRASFGKTSRETEGDIVREMATTRLLILDEVQERGNTAWEDRLLTHILDKRYGAMVPTIVIANLTEAGLIECLGDSIISRLTETGGVISVDGPSHRNQP